jgi:hypothetical protein
VLKAKAKARAKAELLFCRSWLAGDADNSVYQAHPVDAIAGKPACMVRLVGVVGLKASI